MKITDKMDLDELAVRMGGATASQARHMRAALNGLGHYSDTEDVPECVWYGLCEAAVAQARHDDGEVEFQGQKYALTSQAQLTNRVFDGWFGDAREGEEYISEWSAPATGQHRRTP